MSCAVEVLYPVFSLSKKSQTTSGWKRWPRVFSPANTLRLLVVVFFIHLLRRLLVLLYSHFCVPIFYFPFIPSLHLIFLIFCSNCVPRTPHARCIASLMPLIIPANAGCTAHISRPIPKSDLRRCANFLILLALIHTATIAHFSLWGLHIVLTRFSFPSCPFVQSSKISE